jgi:hypothetical protein
MTDDDILTARLATVRAYLSTLEALAAAEVRDAELCDAEQAAYRALDLNGARMYAQQRWITRPVPR